MTQEYKELLLKDLCSRLFYGVKCVNVNWPKDGYVEVSNIRVTEQKVQIFEDWVDVEYCKPYLRSLSSMTEEEMIEYYDNDYTEKHNLFTIPNPKKIDWLNAHHFDYRGLIEKGLALEASEGMYKID